MSGEPRRDRLDYVILYVDDVEAAARLLGDVVGLELKLLRDGYAEFATRGAKFGLYERARLPGLIGEGAARDAPAAEVLFLVPDVDAEAERLRGIGARILSGPTDRPWGHRTLHVAGPGGVVIELAQQIPRAEPAEGTAAPEPDRGAPGPFRAAHGLD